MEALLSILVFLGFGFAFVFVNLTLGRLVRPSLPNREKNAVYECGEPTFGSSWVQFDLRFYIVALFYLVFDVEVALIYPWAVVFREFPLEAMIAGVPFLGIVVLGYAYEWSCGSLDWVRSSISNDPTLRARADVNLGALARRDPEALEDEAEAGAAAAAASAN